MPTVSLVVNTSEASFEAYWLLQKKCSIVDVCCLSVLQWTRQRLNLRLSLVAHSNGKNSWLVRKPNLLFGSCRSKSNNLLEKDMC